MGPENYGASSNDGFHEDHQDYSSSADHHEALPGDQINMLVNNMIQQRYRDSHFGHDKGVAEIIMGLGPLGLTLHKTPDFLSSIEMALVQERSTPTTSSHDSDHSGGGGGGGNGGAGGLERRRCDNNNYMSQPEKEKLKASNFSAKILKIGSWHVESKNEGDLVAKCYYAKRKLVWEVLEQKEKLKRKIEIQWSDISAIRATIRKDQQGILEIELNQPPTFFQEQNPQPRKHTIWSTTTDFTEGQAPRFRRHYLKFEPGLLDKPYEKLLQADSRLMKLSQQPFPSTSSLCFEEFPYLDFSLGFNSRHFYKTPDISASALPLFLPTMPIVAHQSPLQSYQPPKSTSPDSVIDFRPTDDITTSSRSYSLNQNQMAYNWNQQVPGGSKVSSFSRGQQIQYALLLQHQQQQQQAMSITNTQVINQDYHHLPHTHQMLSSLESQLFSDSQPGFADHKTYMDRVNSFNNLINNQQEGHGSSSNIASTSTANGVMGHMNNVHHQFGGIDHSIGFDHHQMMNIARNNGLLYPAPSPFRQDSWMENYGGVDHY